MSLHDYLRNDPSCAHLAEGAIHAVAPLLDDPDPSSTLELLDDWAFQLAGRMPLPWSLHAAIDAINHFLFTEQELRGDRQHYDDPQNSILPRVIARRRGLPITLSILWIDVAQRLGFDACGVALPGHFITALRTDVGNLYFDPFNGGRALGEEEAVTLVRRASQGRMEFTPEMLHAVNNRTTLARLVRNLHVRFVHQGSWDEALWTSTHLLLLNPSDPAPHRDRAFVHLKRGEVMAAVKDLQEALRLSQEDETELALWIEKLQGK